MWIADVGQTAREEINQVPGAASGLNFGWPCREGLHVYNPEAVCPDPLTYPVLEYAHSNSNSSVTGGYVYRIDDADRVFGAGFETRICR